MLRMTPEITWSVDIMQVITIVVMLIGFASVAGQFKADMTYVKDSIIAIKQDHAKLASEVKDIEIKMERTETILNRRSVDK